MTSYLASASTAAASGDLEWLGEGELGTGGLDPWCPL